MEMRTLQFDSFGEPLDVVSLAKVPLPDPGPGQVRVRMSLCPVNPSDLYQIRGRYGRLPDLPAVPGLEGVGRVEALGPEVPAQWMGQRVVFREIQGTWAECLMAPTHALVSVPDQIPEEAAAQAMVNPLTALVMVEELNPAPGDWVLITAPGSAVAHGVLDLARVRGFRVLALDRSLNRADTLRAKGASEVLSTEDPTWFRQARTLLGAQGAAGCLDAVGGPLASDLVKLLRPGGLHLVYGALSLQPLQIPGGQIIYRQLVVRGFMIWLWKRGASEARLASTLETLWDLQSQGLLCPPVAQVHPLEDFKEALALAEARERKGKVLLSLA